MFFQLIVLRIYCNETVETISYCQRIILSINTSLQQHSILQFPSKICFHIYSMKINLKKIKLKAQYAIEFFFSLSIFY